MGRYIYLLFLFSCGFNAEVPISSQFLLEPGSVYNTDGNQVQLDTSNLSNFNVIEYEIRTYTDPECSQSEQSHGLFPISNTTPIIGGLSDGLYWTKAIVRNEFGVISESNCFESFITVNSFANNLPSLGLTLWLDGYQSSSFFSSSDCSGSNPTNGEAIGCILDLSKNTNHGIQTDNTYKPEYSQAHLNSKNVIRLNNKYLVINNEQNFDFTDEYTIFIVFRIDSWNQTFETIFSKGDQVFSSKRFGGAATLRYETEDDASPRYNALNIPTAVNDATYRYARYTFDTDFKEVYFGGVLEGSVTAPLPGLLNNSFQVCLGCDLETDTFNRLVTDGYVAEFMIYNRKLTPVEMGQVESYFQTKWGL